MPRIVPSQVCQYISTIPAQESPNGLMRMNSIGAAPLSSVLQLSEGIPDELLTMDSHTYGLFVTAKEQIRETLKTWRDNRSANQALFGFDLPKLRNPLFIIRDALVNCPDESPSPSTSELNFISDPDLKMGLRNDIGSVNRAPIKRRMEGRDSSGWRRYRSVAVVALQRRDPTAVATAATGLMSSGRFRNQPSQDLERWNLFEFIEVSANLGVIKPDTAIQTTLAREFRNLIHPGRAQRLGQKCDRATALSAVAGVEHVVRDLTP